MSLCKKAYLQLNVSSDETFMTDESLSLVVQNLIDIFRAIQFSISDSSYVNQARRETLKLM